MNDNNIKGYYLYEYRDNESLGVLKKIDDQCLAFKNSSIECEKLCLQPKGGRLYKILRRIIGCTDNIQWPDIQDILDADFLYIRKVIVTWHFLDFLSKVRKAKPDMVVIVEIPTYPYDRELISMGILSLPLLLRDSIGRRFLYKYIDYIAIPGMYSGDTLWKVSVIHFVNGINIADFDVRTPYDDDDVIRVMCIASFTRGHGIDRFIRGMSNYYQNVGIRKIELHLAGYGKEYDRLQSLVDSDTHIRDRVFFHGTIQGKEKDELYDKCDIGIVALGWSSMNIKCSSGLKSREYMAVGLPFICDVNLDIFEGKKVSYFHEVSRGIKPISIDDIICFYDDIYPNNSAEYKRKLAEYIRRDAESLIDINPAMASVISIIRKGHRNIN